MKTTFKHMLKLSASVALSLGFSMSVTAQSDYVHYSFPVNQVAEFEAADQAVQESSKSYWREISGAELNAGVALHNTAPQALVLLSYAQGGGSYKTIDSKQLYLLGQGGAVESRSVSEEALAETGFFARSVALMARDSGNAGALTLKSDQAFADDDRFVLTVKEKKSPFSLEVKAQGRYVSPQSTSLVSASMMHFSRSAVPLSASQTEVTAFLHTPEGQRLPLDVNISGDALMVATPLLNEVSSPVDGLYDVEMQINTRINGQTVMRSAKLAMAMRQDTASLEGVALQRNGTPQAQVQYIAQAPGRYEARAVLFGYNTDNKLVALMEGHAAQTVNAGAAQLAIPFDVSKLAKDSFRGPFEVGHVRLYDQSQLALLDERTQRVRMTLADSGKRQ